MRHAAMMIRTFPEGRRVPSDIPAGYHNLNVKRLLTISIGLRTGLASLCSNKMDINWSCYCDLFSAHVEPFDYVNKSSNFEKLQLAPDTYANI